MTIDDSKNGRVEVNAHGRELDLSLRLAVQETVRTAMVMTSGPGTEPMSFLQLGGPYHVTGRIGERPIDFSARGAAETFRPHYRSSD